MRPLSLLFSLALAAAVPVAACSVAACSSASDVPLGGPFGGTATVPPPSDAGNDAGPLAATATTSTTTGSGTGTGTGTSVGSGSGS